MILTFTGAAAAAAATKRKKSQRVKFEVRRSPIVKIFSVSTQPLFRNIQYVETYSKLCWLMRFHFMAKTMNWREIEQEAEDFLPSLLERRDLPFDCNKENPGDESDYKSGKQPATPNLIILLFVMKRIDNGMNDEKMEGACGIDHFARIPDELLGSILTRLDNLKDMFACSLLSKRFALTIYQIKSVSLTLPSTEIPSAALANKIDELFVKLVSFSSEEIIRFIQSSPIKELKFLPFLQNFRELRSISLEFTCPRLICSSSLFKMRVKFRNGGAVVDKYVSLIAGNVSMETEQGYYYELGYETFKGKESITGTFLPIGCCTNWLLVLCLLLKCHPLLVSVTITNSKKQGKLVLRDKQLVAWRNNLVPEGFLHSLTPYSRTSGWVNEVYVPQSACLLRSVNFVIARPMKKRGYVSRKVDDDETITWEYVGGGKLMRDVEYEFRVQYNDPHITSILAD